MHEDVIGLCVIDDISAATIVQVIRDALAGASEAVRQVRHLPYQKFVRY